MQNYASLASFLVCIKTNLPIEAYSVPNGVVFSMNYSSSFLHCPFPCLNTPDMLPEAPVGHMTHAICSSVDAAQRGKKKAFGCSGWNLGIRRHTVTP